MCNVDYDVSYEFMLNDYEGQAQICPPKKQVITLNSRISTVMCFESRPLASRPHLRKGYFSLDDFHAWAACNGQNSKE